MNRREFTIAGGAALASWFSPTTLAHQQKQWAPYAKTLAIDALGGMFPSNTDGSFSENDLAAIRESGLSGVVLTLAPSGPSRFDDAAHKRTLAELDNWDGKVRARPETFTLVRTGADLKRAHEARKLGLIYGFQDTSPLGEDLKRIDMSYERGVRVIQLTHNKRNLVGDGCMEPGNAGLSQFGHEVIAGLNARRILVDLSHGGRRTIKEAIAVSKVPLIIGHTGCAALSDLPRNVPDEILRAMANRGGVAGIIFWPYLRRDVQPTAEDVIRHIEHAIDVCGEDHVGIGTDGNISPTERTPEFERENREWVEMAMVDGIFERGRPLPLYTFIPELNHARRFETLGALLSARGHSDTRIAKVLGGNFARVMQEVWG
jgi:membrane dipeptidase